MRLELWELTSFPSALYGEKCSESVIPASLTPVPFVLLAMVVDIHGSLK